MNNNTTSVFPLLNQSNSFERDATLIVSTYLSELATDAGRRVQRQSLDKIADLFTDGIVQTCRLFPWHLVRYEHAQIIRAKLIELYKPATVNRSISALRGVLRAAFKIGLMTADNFHRAIGIKNLKAFSLPAGREITKPELSSLFELCAKDRTTAGLRDFALISVMYGGGLRREEVANLDYSNFEMSKGRLRVMGKGRKERYCYLPAGTISALLAWCSVRGEFEGTLFTRIYKGGVVDQRSGHMTGQAVYKIILRRANDAGISDISPHDMRRTFITTLLSNGQDIGTVSKMAGHANIQTTMIYDRRNDDAKIKAAATLTIPFGELYGGETCQ